MLYGINSELPSKAAFDPDEPSLGRIRALSVAPPRSLTSFKQCISGVERNSAFTWHADFFTDTSCNTPLNESLISVADGPLAGRSPKAPMTIILRPLIQNGRYAIRNRAITRDGPFLRGIKSYWHAQYKQAPNVHSTLCTMDYAKKNLQVNKYSLIVQAFK